MQSLYNKNHKIKKMNNHPGKNPRQYKNEKTIPYDIHFFLALKYFSFHYFPQTLSFTTQMTASRSETGNLEQVLRPGIFPLLPADPGFSALQCPLAWLIFSIKKSGAASLLASSSLIL